jgi:HSP20 family protein
MTDDDKNNKKKSRRDEFPFDDLLKAIGETFNQWFESFSGADPEELEEVLKKFFSSPMVFGGNVTIGPDGTPRFQRFGSKIPTGGVSPGKEREPLVDVYDQGNTLRVIAEVPGVPKEHIRVRTEVQKVLITASGGERNYSKVIDLPCKIIPDSAQAKYNFGVLEITLQKIEPSEDGSSVDVPIE